MYWNVNVNNKIYWTVTLHSGIILYLTSVLYVEIHRINVAEYLDKSILWHNESQSYHSR